MNSSMKLLYVLFLLSSINLSYADNIGSQTGLEIPRYVSLKSNDSNMRVGPSKNYPIKLNYISKNYPVKIIDEYLDWRKVEDFEKNTGWMHKSLLKGERYGLILSTNKSRVNIYNSINGKVIGEINTKLIVRLSKCKIDWCFILINNYKGWIRKKNIWGVKGNEKFNISFIEMFNDYYFKSINYIDRYINTK